MALTMDQYLIPKPSEDQECDLIDFNDINNSDLLLFQQQNNVLQPMKHLLTCKI